MSFAYKTTTNITGLPVAKNARNRLLALYNKILKELVKMPESCAYRKNTEEIVRYRSSVLEKETDLNAIEKKIGSGQIEELMMQAKNELTLSRKLLVYKPWESLIKAPKNQWNWPPH